MFTKYINKDEKISAGLKNLFDLFHKGDEHLALLYLSNSYKDGERELFSSSKFVQFLSSLCQPGMSRLSFRETDIYQWWLGLPADEVNFKAALPAATYFLMKDDIVRILQDNNQLTDREMKVLDLELRLRKMMDDIYDIRAEELFLFSENAREFADQLKGLKVDLEVSPKNELLVDLFSLENIGQSLITIKKIIGRAYLDGEISESFGQKLLAMMAQIEQTMTEAIS